MKSVKLPYPVSFQELLRLSVQPRKTIEQKPKPRSKPKEPTQK